MMSFRLIARRWTTPAVLLLACTLTAPARAQTAEDSTKAEKLFNDASALAAAEKYVEACPLFAESQRLDPALGTEFNLALCYEKIGRLASAWRAFREVQALAHATGKKGREDSAHEKMAALRPRLQYFAIVLQEAAADVVVKVDGAPVKPEDLAFVPVDTGEHEIYAVAQGKRPWSTKVSIAERTPKVDVVVPALQAIPGQTRIVTVTKNTSNTRRTLGYAIGGLGVVGVGAAVVTGIVVLNEKAAADRNCTPTCADPSGRSAVATGKTLVPINYIAWGVGVVGVGVGAYLLLTSRPKAGEPPRAQVTLVPMIAADGARLGLSGTL